MQSEVLMQHKKKLLSIVMMGAADYQSLLSPLLLSVSVCNSPCLLYGDIPALKKVTENLSPSVSVTNQLREE